MGQGADGDQSGAGFRVGARALGRDAARRLHGDARARPPHPRRHALGCLVVGEDVPHSCRERLFELRLVLHLNDDRRAGRRAGERRGKTARSEQCPVIVLPEDRFGERPAIFDAAPDGDGVALKRPQPRGGLARVGDPGSGPRHRLHRPAGQRRNAREALQKVEGDPLARQQRRGGRPHTREDSVGPYPLPFAAQRLDARLGVELRIHPRDDRESRDDERVFGHEMRARGAPRRGTEQPGGHVVSSAVLLQGAPHLFQAERLSQSPASGRSHAARARLRPRER